MQINLFKGFLSHLKLPFSQTPQDFWSCQWDLTRRSYPKKQEERFPHYLRQDAHFHTKHTSMCERFMSGMSRSDNSYGLSFSRSAIIFNLEMFMKFMCLGKRSYHPSVHTRLQIFIKLCFEYFLLSLTQRNINRIFHLFRREVYGAKLVFVPGLILSVSVSATLLSRTSLKHTISYYLTPSLIPS